LAVSQAGADEIVLVGGDIIHGKIIGQSDLAVVLEHEDLGRIEISRDRIKSMTFDSPETGEAQEPSKEADIKTQQQTEAEEIEETSWLDRRFKKIDAWSSEMKKKGWSFSADLSLDDSSGNTDERSMRIGVKAKRELEDRRFKMDISYFNKVSESDTTDNKASLGIARDWLKPESPWFFFLMGRFDYDEFESWDERAAGHAGPGYHLIADDKVTLDLRVGAGARKEWGSENDNVRAEGAGGLALNWKITERQSLNASSFIYPVLSDTDDYRTRSSMDWRFLLHKESKVSLLVGLLHEYQSIVDPGKDRNDLRIYTGIRYEF
jgi:putative salt-induced outer membrane protein YdiY